MKKLIFVDIDGTILACEKGLENPSPLTVYAIEELKRNGHEVFIASGRPHCLLPKSVIDLKPSGFLLMNGTDLYKDQNHLQNTFLKNADVKKIIDFVNEKDGLYYLETNKCIYTEDLMAIKHIEFAKDWQCEEAYSDEAYDENAISMAMIVLNNEEDMNEAIDTLSDTLDLRRHRFGLSFDVNVKGVSKGKAIADYISGQDVKTFAIGDGLNDLEMMQEVDVAIAMGNAETVIKKLADMITDDVLNDGFYKALVKLELISPK